MCIICDSVVFPEVKQLTALQALATGYLQESAHKMYVAQLALYRNTRESFKATVAVNPSDLRLSDLQLTIDVRDVTKGELPDGIFVRFNKEGLMSLHAWCADTAAKRNEVFLREKYIADVTIQKVVDLIQNEMFKIVQDGTTKKEVDKVLPLLLKMISGIKQFPNK